MELDIWATALLEPDLSNTLGPQLSLDIAEPYFVQQITFLIISFLRLQMYLSI